MSRFPLRKLIGAFHSIPMSAVANLFIKGGSHFIVKETWIRNIEYQIMVFQLLSLSRKIS